MHSNSPRPAVEDPEPPTDDDYDDEVNDPTPPPKDEESEDEMEDDDSDDEPNDDSVPDEQLGAQSERDDYRPPHPNTIVLPVKTRPIEELLDAAANERDRSPKSMNLTRHQHYRTDQRAHAD